MPNFYTSIEFRLIQQIIVSEGAQDIDMMQVVGPYRVILICDSCTRLIEVSINNFLLYCNSMVICNKSIDAIV